MFQFDYGNKKDQAPSLKSAGFLLGLIILIAASEMPTFFNEYAWNWQMVATILISIATFAALMTDIRPPHIVMFLSSAILVILGIISPQQFLNGYSNDVVMTIAMLCIVVRTLEVNGVLNLFSRYIFSNSKNQIVQYLWLLIPVAGLSAFLNNTPIVLLLTPLVRKWALSHRLAPSKFLIPLSYITILGGLCTLIGTSTNLLVEGLLAYENPGARLGFFELGFIGVPLVIIGLVYLLFIGRYLLPDRQDHMAKMAMDSQNLVGEFIVERHSAFVGKTIQELYEDLESIQLLEIERAGTIWRSPLPGTVIRPHDRLVLEGEVDQIAALHNVPGFTSVADPHFNLEVESSHFSVAILSCNSPLVGKTLKQLNFRHTYGASVFAIYRRGKRLSGTVSKMNLLGGDMLMLFSSDTWRGEDYPNDFYTIRLNEKVISFNRWRITLVLGIVVGMVTAAALGISMMVSSLTAAVLLLLTRSVTVREAQKSIAWTILVLIASCLAFSSAMETTGLASAFGKQVLDLLGSNPYALIGGILFITIIGTEILSNNASAVLIFPIALEAVRLAGYQDIEAIKTVGVAVAVGSSAGFAVPTGYQTHLIVYGPGNYRFLDFVKVGFPLDILIWITGTCLIPYLWPLH